MSAAMELFDLRARVAVITGGAGLLGAQHAHAIASSGGIPVILDVQEREAKKVACEIRERYDVRTSFIVTDITRPETVRAAFDRVMQEHGRVDILINNAANNPKIEKSSDVNFSRFEHFPIEQWNDDIAVGLTGAYLCSQIFGAQMARVGRGVIVNVASDLALIGPDQRLYRQDGLPESLQPVKPITYSVVKTALIGLTRYLATYWAGSGIRVNAISPGGVFNDQSDVFVSRLAELIPLKRMATIDEYRGAILFLCSDASSYMTGANLVIDGGRTCL